MPSKSSSPPSRGLLHPGQHVREAILKPKGMSVTEAAKIIGVSRPGVSNFLNGKVATTPDMASRVERAFQIPAQRLLDMQAAYDAAQARERGAPVNAKAYVPPSLPSKRTRSKSGPHRISRRAPVYQSCCALSSTRRVSAWRKWTSRATMTPSGRDGTAWLKPRRNPLGPERTFRLGVRSQREHQGQSRLGFCEKRQGYEKGRSGSDNVRLHHPAPLVRKDKLDRRHAGKKSLEGRARV